MLNRQFQHFNTDEFSTVFTKKILVGKEKLAGFTVLELLIVVAILAAVAMIATSSFVGGGRNVETDAKIKIAKSEMTSIARAVKQFKADTGYYPKEGVFAHKDLGGQTIGSNATNYSSESDKYSRFSIDGFYEPYNLDQLFSQPIDFTNGEFLLPWDNSAGHGWNGPYLNRQVAYLDASDETDTESPIADQWGSDVVSSDYGFSTYGNDVVFAGAYDQFSRSKSSYFFKWNTVKYPDPGDKNDRKKFLGPIGGPYMIFGLNATMDNDVILRVVSSGPDGDYQGLNDPAGSVTSRDNCSPKAADSSADKYREYELDLVLCF